MQEHSSTPDQRSLIPWHVSLHTNTLPDQGGKFSKSLKMHLFLFVCSLVFAFKYTSRSFYPCWKIWLWASLPMRCKQLEAMQACSLCDEWLTERSFPRHTVSRRPGFQAFWRSNTKVIKWQLYTKNEFLQSFFKNSIKTLKMPSTLLDSLDVT